MGEEKTRRQAIEFICDAHRFLFGSGSKKKAIENDRAQLQLLLQGEAEPRGRGAITPLRQDIAASVISAVNSMAETDINRASEFTPKIDDMTKAMKLCQVDEKRKSLKGILVRNEHMVECVLRAKLQWEAQRRLEGHTKG